jgi:DNA-binding NtrC family response regulator
MRKSLVGAEPAAWLDEIEKDLESLKWHLWNGNVDQALRLVDELKTMLDGEEISAERQKLLCMIRDFGNYIADNQAFIPDYGDRHRNGRRISSAFAESAVNQLVSRRMIKRQQMHWTKRGAHLLLQVRSQVLNGDLRDSFRRWYPGMKAGSEGPLRRVA